MEPRSLPDPGRVPSDSSAANDPAADLFAGSVAHALRLARICGLHGVRFVEWLGRPSME